MTIAGIRTPQQTTPPYSEIILTPTYLPACDEHQFRGLAASVALLLAMLNPESQGAEGRIHLPLSHLRREAWLEGPVILKHGERPPRAVSPYGTISLQDERVTTGQVAPRIARPSWYWELKPTPGDPLARAAKVYCSGDLLAAVQMSSLFDDSKEFVDMPMRTDPEAVLQDFSALSASEREDPQLMKAFINQHFAPAGTDIVLHDPQDFTTHPSLLDRVKQGSTYYAWVQALNNEWKLLVRKVAEDAITYPQRHSVLWRKHPFVIPGGRFRESYYWDSYWIVLGLLACDMKDTAKGLVSNLLDDVAMFGFVPNGGRLYYLNRSQPPLLSDMVTALLTRDAAPRQDKAFMSNAFATLEREYAYWMTEGEHAIRLSAGLPTGTDGGVPTACPPHLLNRYFTSATSPRPESYKEDVATKQEAGTRSEEVLADIAAGAESGWDFSSRWILDPQGNGHNLSYIETSRLLPVELNAYLYRMERNMARLAQLIDTGVMHDSDYGDWTSCKALLYHEASYRRARAMDELMWSETDGCWKDYDLQRGATVRNQLPGENITSVSSYVPLWSGVLRSPATKNGKEKGERVQQSLQNSGLIQVGGIQTTTKETEEQWDAPNAWSPIQHMIIEGLEGLGTPQASSLALQLTKDWLASNHLGWANTGQMYEKYHAKVPGARGEGGEYYPQVGFGWTNGVVLHLLEKYADKL